MPKDTRIPITVRLDPAFHGELEEKLLKTKIRKKQALVEKLLREWLGSEHQMKDTHLTRHQQEVDRLIWLLDHASESERDLILDSLKSLEQLVKSHKQQLIRPSSGKPDQVPIDRPRRKI